MIQPQQMSAARIAVVIPCFRVRSHICGVIERIGPECDRVYIVDDCCPEKSGEHVLENFNDPRITVIASEKNLGVGGAVMLGYKRAVQDGATVLVKIDGDGQMDPAHLARFVQPILDGEADYTKGNRFYSIEMLKGMPLVRVIGNSVLSFMSKLSSGYWSIFDPTNGYTAMHARAFQVLPLEKISPRYFFESDILFRLNISRAVVMDIPMFAIYGNEKSNLRVPKMVHLFFARHLVNSLKRIFYCYFLRDFSIASIFLVLGVLLILFGFTFGAFEWYRFAQAGVPATAGTVMLAALPVFLGFQLLVSFFAYDIANTPSRPIHKQLPFLGWSEK